MPSRKIIGVAVKSAQKSEHMSGYYHGAVLYSGGKILRVGQNHAEFHAEQDVVRRSAKSKRKEQQVVSTCC